MLDFSPNELQEVVRRIFSVSYLSVHRYGTDCVESVPYLSVHRYGTNCVESVPYLSVHRYGTDCVESVPYLSVHRYGTDCVEIGSPGADIKHDAGVSLSDGTVRKEGPFLLAIGT